MNHFLCQLRSFDREFLIFKHSRLHTETQANFIHLGLYTIKKLVRNKWRNHSHPLMIIKEESQKRRRSGIAHSLPHHHYISSTIFAPTKLYCYFSLHRLPLQFHSSATIPSKYLVCIGIVLKISIRYLTGSHHYLVLSQEFLQQSLLLQRGESSKLRTTEMLHESTLLQRIWSLAYLEDGNRRWNLLNQHLSKLWCCLQ